MKKCLALVLTLTLLVTIFSINIYALEDVPDNNGGVSADKTVISSVDTESSGEKLLKKSDKASFIFDTLEGTYNIKVFYRQSTTKFTHISIGVSVDGSALNGNFSLEHLWQYSDDYSEDTQGNQIAPKQIAYEGVGYKYLTDKPNSIDYYELNLSQGRHIIEFLAEDDEFYIVDVQLVKVSSVPEYSEYIKAAEKNASSKSQKDYEKVYQAEDGALKSDKSILVANERNSLAVEPYDVVKNRYNYMGGDNWSDIGSYIEWKISVPEDGFYNIAFHIKQSAKLNDNSYRMLTLDGELPFAEAKNIKFAYDRTWNTVKLGEEEQYMLYLTADSEHTLRLSSSMGEYSYLIEAVADIVDRLNADYLNILMLTGANPDVYRDYKFDKAIPDTIADLKAVSKELKEIEKEWGTYTSGGASLADIQQMYQLIDKILDDTDTIAARLSLMNTYISSLQVWVSARSEQPLAIDSFTIYSPEKELKEKKSGFFKVLWHNIVQFLVSFTTDYSAIGNVDVDTEDSITVWLGADAAPIAASAGGTGGRDQAQIVTRLVANEFTPKYKTSVKVQLVNSGSLLSAVVAGIGPDVALGLGQSTPVNYALRNAIVDLSELEGIDEVLKDFDESAITPFRLEGGIYALPQSVTWPMLFYRKDILNNLGISVDSLKTWNGIKREVIPILEINNLSFGMENMYTTLLYQMGGHLYSDDHMQILIDTTESIAAFTEVTNLFLESGLPVYFNFPDRFRNGTMPVGIASYTMYNQLSVSAPEIAELWGMIPIPATVREDGTLSNVAIVTSEGCGIFKEDNLDASWNFLKWWVSTETQVTFSQELESLLGSAARNPVANNAARSQLGWSDEFKTALDAQANNLVGIPEVAGGYYTTRYLGFAFTDVVYNGKNVIETISSVKKDIDAEILVKTEELLRKEKK